MSNIQIRKNGGQELAPVLAREWEPFRMMRDLLRWDPFREMAPIWSGEERAAGSYIPTFEVKETKDGFVFKADVPGVKEQDLEVSLTGNRLTVSGKREAEREDKGDTYFTYERSYGSFTRSFTLPDGVDAEHVRADLKDGVLSLILPKRPEMKPKKIDVKASDKAKA